MRTVDLTPPRQSATALTEEQLLDVGVALFDPNIPEDYDAQIEQIIQPEIRLAEARYMPFVAKNMLQSTGNWGAVRVVPRQSDAVDLSVNGKIIESDGEKLVVDIRVTDASGKTWFDKRYTSLASKYVYLDKSPQSIDAFQGLYRDLANDMLSYRETLSSSDVLEIRQTAEMKFARSFAADAFSGYLLQIDEGEYQLLRLPAENDPMLMRVREIREREYLLSLIHI